MNPRTNWRDPFVWAMVALIALWIIIAYLPFLRLDLIGLAMRTLAAWVGL